MLAAGAGAGVMREMMEVASHLYGQVSDRRAAGPGKEPRVTEGRAARKRPLEETDPW